MKNQFCIMFGVIICLLSAYGAQGQVMASDTIKNRHLFAVADTITSRVHAISIPQPQDTIKNGLAAPYDSLKTKVNSSRNKLKQKIDSLNIIGAATEKEQKVLDSINQLLRKPDEYYNKAKGFQSDAVNDLKENIPGYDTLNELKTKAGQKLSDINDVTNDLGIGTLGSDLSPVINTDLNGNLLPDMDYNTSINGLDKPEIDTNLPADTSLPDLTDTKMPSEVQTVTEKLDDVKKITDQGAEILNETETYANEIKNVQEQGLGRSEKLDAVAEQQVQRVEGMAELQQMDGEIQQLTGMAKPKSEEEIKKELIEQAKDLATDVMIAHQPKIDASMKKLKKYSRKFSDVPDMRDLPKRPTNPMKELHWRERVVPGIITQSMTFDKYYFQVDPHLYYKISGLFSAGVGGMYRFSMNAAKVTFSDFGKLTGGKIFVQGNIYKGFFIHSEAQKLKWKPMQLAQPDPLQWDKGTVFAAGIGKAYKIGNRINGNMQTLYHWYWGDYDPYKSKILIRIGIDFSIKKREKKPWEEKLKAAKRNQTRK